MRTDIDRNSLPERNSILWRMVVALGMCAVATFWAVPRMIGETQGGSWPNYLVGAFGGVGVTVLVAAIKPTWFIARKPTTRSYVKAIVAIVAAQVAMTLWFDDMSASFQLVLLGIAVGVFAAMLVTAYLVTERTRLSLSEEPRLAR